MKINALESPTLYFPSDTLIIGNWAGQEHRPRISRTWGEQNMRHIREELHYDPFLFFRSVHPLRLCLVTHQFLWVKPLRSFMLCVNDTVTVFHGVRNEQSWPPAHRRVWVNVRHLPVNFSLHSLLAHLSLTTLQGLLHVISWEDFSHSAHHKVPQKCICGRVNEYSPA